MGKAIYNSLEKHSKSFKQMDYDESFFSAREGIITAIQDMEDEVQTPASSQAEHQLSTSEVLEEGHVEEREASSPVSVAITSDVTEDKSLAKLDNSVPIHSDDELEEL